MRKSRRLIDFFIQMFSTSAVPFKPVHTTPLGAAVTEKAFIEGVTAVTNTFHNKLQKYHLYYLYILQKH